ncbi:hypothetical protein QOT17_002085 [Balamuthia mandrillaris]
MNLYFGANQEAACCAPAPSRPTADGEGHVELAKQRVEALSGVEAVLRRILLEEDRSLRRELVQWLADSFALLDEVLSPTSKAECILRFFGREEDVARLSRSSSEPCSFLPTYTEALLQLLCQRRPEQVLEELLALRPGFVRSFFMGRDASSTTERRHRNHDAQEDEEEAKERAEQRERSERRIAAWFDYMAPRGGDKPVKGGQALEQYCLRHRGSLWHALAWKRGQSSVSPVMAAHVRSKFSRLDVIATMNNFLHGTTSSRNSDEDNDGDSDGRHGGDRDIHRALLSFWQSDILQQNILSAALEFVELEVRFFVDLLMCLLFREDEEPPQQTTRTTYRRMQQGSSINRLLHRYLQEENMQLLCKHLLPCLDDQKLLAFYHNLVAVLERYSHLNDDEGGCQRTPLTPVQRSTRFVLFDCKWQTLDDVLLYSALCNHRTLVISLITGGAAYAQGATSTKLNVNVKKKKHKRKKEEEDEKDESVEENSANMQLMSSAAFTEVLARQDIDRASHQCLLRLLLARLEQAEQTAATEAEAHQPTSRPEEGLRKRKRTAGSASSPHDEPAKLKRGEGSSGIAVERRAHLLQNRRELARFMLLECFTLQFKLNVLLGDARKAHRLLRKVLQREGVPFEQVYSQVPPRLPEGKKDKKKHRKEKNREFIGWKFPASGSGGQSTYSTLDVPPFLSALLFEHFSHNIP